MFGMYISVTYPRNARILLYGDVMHCISKWEWYGMELDWNSAMVTLELDLFYSNLVFWKILE